MEELLLLAFIVLAVIQLVQMGRIKRMLSDLESGMREVRRKLPWSAELQAKPVTESKSAPTVTAAPSAPAPVPATARPPGPPPVPVSAPVAASVPVRPPAPPPMPVPLHPAVEAARDILRRIWSWIVVGEEHRTPGVSMEYAVATTWLIRAGIVAIVTCIGYFLKWSIDRNLLGPEARVGLSVFFGLVLLVSGTRLLSRKWRLLGQGLLGGGVAILYFSIYAAGPLYHLVPRTVAFALMILVTVAVGVLALRQDSMLVAILGLIGGYCTPLLLRTGSANLPVLYAYLVLLGLGVLGMAQARPWRLLNYLSFLFTYGIYLASLPGSTGLRAQPQVYLGALAAFFALHASLVYGHNIRRGIKATVLEIIYLVLNAAVAGWMSYWIVRVVWGRPYPALATLLLSVFFVLHVALFLQRKIQDRTLLIALLALAAFFATLTVPLVLARESLTIAWSLLALMFLWLGGRLDSPFLRHAGHALYLIVFGRLALLDLPRRFEAYYAPDTFAAYWRGMVDRAWTFGISIGSVLAAFYLERAYVKKLPAEAAGREAEERSLSGVVRQVFYWFVLLFLFAYAQLETHRALGFYLPLRQPALTLLWVGMAGYFLYRFRTEGRGYLLWVLGAFLGVAILKTLAVDLDEWRLGTRWWFTTDYTGLAVAMRWLDFGGTLVLLGAGWRFLAGPGAPRNLYLAFGYGGLALLFFFATLEIRSLLHAVEPAFIAGGTSVLWALFAVAFLVAGIRYAVKPLRYAGLGLFVVVVAKVFLVDLAGMPTLYRVIAFMVVGLVLLASAFAYIRASSSFNQENPS